MTPNTADFPIPLPFRQSWDRRYRRGGGAVRNVIDLFSFKTIILYCRSLRIVNIYLIINQVFVINQGPKDYLLCTVK